MSVYGSCGVTQMRRLQKVVILCARVVTGRRRFDHISDAIEQLGWQTAQCMIDYHTVCVLERVIVTEQPRLLFETIGQQANLVHNHFTRRSNEWTLPAIRTESGRRRLCYRGVSQLNRTGLNPGSYHFKTELKRTLSDIRED